MLSGRSLVTLFALSGFVLFFLGLEGDVTNDAENYYYESGNYPCL